ncbi:MULTISPECIES: ABC transporter ATP-binding protein [Clostridium]|jgi:ABC-2 type transport system ATP-binding protein|nr:MULTISPECIES: ABC transporter ATP-binding protein [Clostridium]MDU2292025.1 ABC transporter ATP-binding protein [Clostridium celatum]MBX9184923.1 ABC transporter ATP-binding protein [Clostridium sp. K04]MDU4325329.1 ABC transporter ATP-binding protein [Clostridium celatum]MEE0725402.1 ABC transporter ATP-binding protein [Clostridium saudiense]CUO22307.1 ABC transporter [Clostridium disporicum]
MTINIKGLTVEFNNGTKAIDNLNLNIEKGIYGLLGENGAGKTTLMRVLTTILPVSKGNILINGINLEKNNYEMIQKQIGYLPQELEVYPSLTVRDSLEYLGRMSGIPKNICKDRIDYYLEKTGLIDKQNKKNKQLSGGMKRRVGLVQALLNEPPILIVDEPTTGLDPEERIKIRNLLVDFGETRTVIFSTHVIEDIASTCNKLGIMQKGNLIFNGEISELLKNAENHVWNCLITNEKEILELSRYATISSKQYVNGNIMTKIISEEKPRIDCIRAEVTLEDAYLYMMKMYEINDVR